MEREFIYQRISEQIDDIEKSVIDQLKDTSPEKYEQYQQKVKELTQETKLRIAFVGQHNAGKSTIVSALTGNKNIKISTNVETDITAPYEWGNVLLYDTPGLWAGVKAEHDREAMAAIEISDLLVFCITSSLFDNLLIEDFVNLAYKKSYKNKIMIVVNKMSQEDSEFDELVQNYKATLEQTLSELGGNLADFPLAFVDAKDYRDGLAEEDEDLVTFSHFTSFIDLLNEQISNKGLYAKLQTRCNMLSDTIADVIADMGTEIDQSLMIILNRLKRTIRHYRNDMRYKVDDIEAALRRDIQNIGDKFASQIGIKEITQDQHDEVKKNVGMVTNQAVEKIEEELTVMIQELDNEIGDILASDIAVYAFESINSSEFQGNTPVAKDYSDFIAKYGQVSKILSNGAKNVYSMSLVNGASSLSKLSASSGSTMHTIVLNVGHFFGKSFKPWGAVKIASAIGKVAYVAGPVLAGVGVVVEVADKIKQEKELKRIQEAKQQCLNSFSSMASDIIKNIDEQYSEFEKEAFDAKSAGIEQIRNDMIQTSTNNSEMAEMLKLKQNEILGILDGISGASEIG